ncbi:MAG: hypothetical protein KKC03_14110 [Bacteroidetes bacterium]|uniref:Uncharacterized protein n=1 Tax=viral metagenome TaxID=1070528 RepID=A0A6H1ZQZ5_9ZZZZ|nr:hypothetical protein [Bacteroidota bacterium]
MPTIKFQDVREVTVTIPNGGDVGHVDFNPGITDQDGVAVAPDTVISEIVGVVGTLNNPCTIMVARAGVLLGIYVAKAQNATGFDQVYTIRVTSLRWHSIQGADHTI